MTENRSAEASSASTERRGDGLSQRAHERREAGAVQPF
ncbi:unnamed protein product [Phaeothamnion confervicola]